ncbi:hypothetical protein RRF57_010400 [Xylaria bambusicola]|uniref:Uncharacterized protein n=1 Tax=Xylaria bambusicola TaxID=326684 RepID=A0AAN7ZCL6_9PEZI
MPFVLWTTLRRLANLTNASEAGGNTEGVVRGIVIEERRTYERIKSNTMRVSRKRGFRNDIDCP